MMGDASIASPIADGIVSKNASRIPRARIARNSSMFPTAALFDTNGRVTVPIATPKIPNGNCISCRREHGEPGFALETDAAAHERRPSFELAGRGGGGH